MGEAKNKITATQDCPYQRVKGGWRLVIPADRKPVVGSAFLPARGYVLTLAFADSPDMNLMPAKSARILAQTMLDRSDDSQARFSDAIIKTSVDVDKLNRAWRAAGAPKTPLENTEGSA